ncbi:MAG: hypothetical protein QOH48_1323 [Actinomycetota bacterium]|jgi:hypothetical protein|nr:hypothetical protein [Actinomycetota bacterium]
MAPPARSSAETSSAPEESPATADWVARYQEYLTRAGDRSKGTQDLYRRIIGRVAEGELTPGAVEGLLNSFLQLHGAEYADKLAEISMRFLTGVVQAGTTYSYELVDRIVPGAVSAPETSPPEFEAADWSDWFGRLTDYATQESAAVLEAVRSVIEGVASGSLKPDAVEEISATHSYERLPESVARMVTLYFDLLSGLEGFSSKFGEQYLKSLLGPDDPDAFAVDLKGSLGEVAVVRLAVANTASESTSVRCVCTDVRRADGVGPAFEPDITISPERFALAPGDERSVALSLTLDDGAYEAGALYVGTFHVLTPDETLLEVPLRIRATEPTPQP